MNQKGLPASLFAVSLAALGALSVPGVEESSAGFWGLLGLSAASFAVGIVVSFVRLARRSVPPTLPSAPKVALVFLEMAQFESLSEDHSLACIDPETLGLEATLATLETYDAVVVGLDTEGGDITGDGRFWYGVFLSNLTTGLVLGISDKVSPVAWENLHITKQSEAAEKVRNSSRPLTHPRLPAYRGK